MGNQLAMANALVNTNMFGFCDFPGRRTPIPSSRGLVAEAAEETKWEQLDVAAARDD
jgi:hypothetical protein